MENVKFDYGKLRGKIREVCGTQDEFALRLGLGRVSLSQTLNNFRDFTGQEIYRTCNILGIDKTEIPSYFFTLEVQKHELQRMTGR